MITKQKGAVTLVTFDESAIELFLTSDVHFDSVFCDRKSFFQDLDEAVKRKAMVCIFGDFFDAMNGRFDPRRDMSMLRPEYRRADYYDFIVNDAYEKLKKYKDNILIITAGNHELSVLKNANTYLTDRLTKQLGCLHGGYGGWLKLFLNVKGIRGSVNIKYFHGSGGEAPVTRGAIQTARQAVYLPDADIVINGHSHNAYWIPIQRERITSKEGTQYFDTQHHVRTPGYMQSYGDGTGGWEVTRGGVPKALGGCFVTIRRIGNDDKQCPMEFHPVIHNGNPISPVNDLFNGTVFPQE